MDTLTTPATSNRGKLQWLSALSACAVLLCASAGLAHGAGQVLVKGQSKIDGVPVFDRAGVQVATKRVNVLWAYSDTDKDGQFIWGGQPLVGDDFRIVNRTIYTFTSDFVPDPAWNGQMATFHWGPLHPVTGLYQPSVFRGVRYDDFIVGLPVPGDYSVTMGMDGLPVPGLSLTGSIFVDAGDWDPALGPTPLAEPRWGMRYILSFAPGTPRVIPAGTVMFMDAQLDMQNLAPDTCENGWSEEDWITTGGALGFVQFGPNTADPASLLQYPTLQPPPLLFVPAGHLCGVPLPVCGDGTCTTSESQCNCAADCGTPPLLETLCADGLDNDCDGFIDCSDADCAAAPVCVCIADGNACTADADCCGGRCRARKAGIICD